MRTGTVVSFNSERGFGFIKYTDEFKHIWFHVHQCQVEPKVGLTVCFMVADSPKGPVAKSVSAPSAMTGATESLSGGAQ